MGSELIKQAGTLVSGQDVLFWLSTAAVAAGLTILVVTGYIALRNRWRNRRPRARRSAPAAAPAARSATAVLGRARLDAYRAAAGTQAVEAGPDELLSRLRSTADSLAELRDDLRRINLEEGESPLKDAAPAVEYIFRKGVG